MNPPQKQFSLNCGASKNNFPSVFLIGLLCAHLGAQPLQPTLFVSDVENGQIELSWPASATDFVLESSTDLNARQQWLRAPETARLVVKHFSIVVTATDAARFFRLRYAPVPLPADPATVASPLPQGSASDVGSGTAFLYTGANPMQTGVTNGTIQPVRAAVLRGRVKQRDGSALSGVRITVLNHPEFGQTLTRADGWFDLAVNGGTTHTVKYDKVRVLSRATADSRQATGLHDAGGSGAGPTRSSRDTRHLWDERAASSRARQFAN